MLELSGVAYEIQTGQQSRWLLRDVSFAADERFVAVTGPSGSGKSTFLAIAGGLLTPQRGDVRFNGISVYGLSAEGRAKLRLEYFGWIMQKPLLLAGVSVLDNVVLPALAHGVTRRAAVRRAQELLLNVGLRDLANQSAEKLSGGEAARVAVCRAMINSPAVIFADEPTASLDAVSAAELITTLQRQMNTERCQLIVVTHDDRLARAAHTRFDLRDGSLHR
jgi:putative ABC transport system ATP-binding protein